MNCYVSKLTANIISPMIATAINATFTRLSSTAIQVSWTSPDLPEISGWIVYYSPNGSTAAEQSVNVTDGSQERVVVRSLRSNVEYVFEVVVVVEVDRVTYLGERVVAQFVMGEEGEY